jgi:hypothetical protein
MDPRTQMFDGIAHQAFGRINTSIAITVASYASDFLGHYMSNSLIILVSTVTFVVLIAFKSSSKSASRGILRSSIEPLTTARSVVGIIVSTTIMQTIGDIGNALSVAPDPTGSSSNAARNTLLLHGMTNPHLPALILGTSFVLLTGIIPPQFQDSAEVGAVTVGVHYAYADIVLASIPQPSVRRVLSFTIIVAVPLLGARVYAYAGSTGPLAMFAQALTFAGVSLVMNSFMPVLVGNPVEDLVRGVAAVLLVHAIMATAESDSPFAGRIAPFAVWRIARRFSSMFHHYGDLEVSMLIGAGLALLHTVVKPLIGGIVVDVVHDLFVLVLVYLIAGWFMHATQSGSGGDAIVLLIAAMAAVRSILSFF